MKKLLSILGSLGLAATAGAGVVACGTSDKEETASVDEILWTNTESKVDKNNVAVFGIKSVGDNVIKNQNPKAQYDEKVVDKIFWDLGSSSIKISLKDNVLKGSYVVTLSFALEGTSQTSTTALIVTKDKPDELETKVEWTSTSAIADTNANIASWTYKDLNQQTIIDTSIKPIVTTSMPKGYQAVSDATIDANAKTLKVTLNDGLPKAVITLDVSFGLKNGFGYSEPIQLFVIKDSATTKESTVNWTSESSAIDDNNSAYWVLKDDGFGKELDLRDAPSVFVSSNPNELPVVKHAKWFKDSRVLKVDFIDGMKKSDYKLEVTFKGRDGFDISCKSTLTAQKVNPSNDEIKMVPDKDYVVADFKNSVTPYWKFKTDNVGLDVDVNYNNKAQITVVKVDDQDVTGLASEVLADWEDFGIRFLGASELSTYGNKGTHAVTFQLKLTNGFDGNIEFTLHYVVK